MADGANGQGPDGRSLGIQTSYVDALGAALGAVQAAIRGDRAREARPDPFPRSHLVVTPPAGDSRSVPPRSGSRTAPRSRSTLLPRDLPIGYHEIRVAAVSPARLIAAPAGCHLPTAFHLGLGDSAACRAIAAQLGIGDLCDLRWLGDGAGADAGIALINPLPRRPRTLPQQASPTFRRAGAFAARCTSGSKRSTGAGRRWHRRARAKGAAESRSADRSRSRVRG